ncbi:MAG: ParA family protein [Clostridia bacterium]|nr:ParA family protein [Clostridia bacterium]
MARIKTIVFANQKGGVGKTTSAVNIAACLAAKGGRVLLVDSDPQGNATSGLGINKRGGAASVYDVLIGRSKASEAIQKTRFAGLYVLPSSMDLVGAEIELVEEDRREYRLRDGLAEVKDSFDYIVIDSPPSLGLLTINALTAADGVVVPLLCEYYSLEGLSQLTQTVKQIQKRYNPSLTLLGVLINMYDGRLNLSLQVMSEIKKYFGEKLFKVPVPRNVRLSEAPSYGEPIGVYDRRSKGALAYEAVTQELAARCGGAYGA